MKLSLLIPGLATPGLAKSGWFNDLSLPALQWCLSRAHRSALVASDALPWLQQTLGVQSCVTLGLDLPGAPAGFWLRADPVHLRVDRDRLLLSDTHLQDLTLAEAQSLVASLNAFLAEDGWQLHAPHPLRWYLRLDKDPELGFTALDRVTGDDIHPHLPAGTGALAWHQRLNEIQMLLYTHPVNDARDAAGKPMVSSIWPWAGGYSPVAPLEVAPFALYGERPEVAGLTASAPVVPELADILSANQPAVVWLDQLRAPLASGDGYAWQQALLQMEAQWLAPAVAALRSGKLSELTLLLPDPDAGFSASVSRRSRLAFWKRTQPFTRLLGAQ